MLLNLAILSNLSTKKPMVIKLAKIGLPNKNTGRQLVFLVAW
ncbi:MAG: hypothetical protein MRECE_38c001 [Mycoplasmataceae bacterium CE_OT135]|nr:MAG: hypothetical protein MRECE_38c001 [Mycoplasmataceae bacterium CE_OT135]